MIFFTKNPNLKKKIEVGEDGFSNRFFLQRIQNVKKKEKIYFLFSVLGGGGGGGGKCFFLQIIEIYTFFGGA